VTEADRPRRPRLRPIAAKPATPPRAKPAARLRRRSGEPLGLTRRGLVLALIAFALTAMTIYPLRQYVTQQKRIEQLQAKQAALDVEIARLEAERARLEDPEYVEQLAREDLQMAKPGEETYVMTGEAPTERSATDTAERPKRPWYKRVWDTLLGRTD
jgi:cell division protein FtsL